MAKRYLEDYIHNALYFTQEAYDYLDEEYRTKKFGTINNYVAYLNERIEMLQALDKYSIKEIDEFASEQEYLDYLGTINTAYLAQYKVFAKNNTKYYMCIDSYGNNYIFSTNDVMNYKVVLDTYTIDLPNFVEEYNKSKDEEKSTMNLQKIATALKEKDYMYVYNKMNDKSAFKNYDEFKSFLTLNLFEYSNIKLLDIEQTEEGYKYILEITDETGLSDKVLQMNVTIMLKDNLEYTIMF